ncbi:uncharacterized protein LOC144665333 [Oculina patagonica]
MTYVCSSGAVYVWFDRSAFVWIQTLSNMADDSSKAANMARVLSIVHIIVGFLLVVFGIADAAVAYFWTGYVGFGIWIGVWMCIAGGLGIPGTRKERSTSRNTFAGIFMGFSITSAVFGGIIIIFYSIAIAEYRGRYGGYRSYYYRYRRSGYDEDMAFSAIILVLGIVEFATGIWASVCLCLMKPCTCCYSGSAPQQGQVMYTANTGYVMTQGPGGVPVAVPMQAGGGMVAVQTVTPGAQGGQPQMVMVPVSGAGSYQPQLAQAAPAGAMTTAYQPQFAQVAPAGAMATGYQPQHVEMPPSYG